MREHEGRHTAADWEVTGYGDDSLQGFATQMSVNKGETVRFKIKSTTTAAYHIDICAWATTAATARA